MKIIFMDVDGVLNTLEGTVNPKLVAIFRNILTNIDAKVVLSSSWKNYEASRNIIKMSVCDFIDCTPQVLIEGRDSTQRRGMEIQAWIDKHPDVEKYAIIDDTGWILEHQLPNFFKTLGSIGLTQEIAEKVIEHLK